LNTRRVIVNYYEGLYYMLHFQTLNPSGHWEDVRSPFVAHECRLEFTIGDYMQVGRVPKND
jgi:hypothetical protein